MAITHGRAGVYGKSQAWRRFERLLFICCMIALAYGVICGILLANMWNPRGLLLGLGLAAVAVVMYWAFTRWLDPYFNSMSRERIKYLRGAQAEAFVGWLLHYLPDDWHVFHSLKLDRAADIDHVAVGPCGVFCISTKSQRGLFDGTPDGLLYNGEPSDFAKQALRQTMDLQKRMEAMMQANVPWVQAVLALPFGYIRGDEACDGNVWLAHQENLTDRLAPDGRPAKLKPAQVQRIVKVLEMLYVDAASVTERRDPAPA